LRADFGRTSESCNPTTKNLLTVTSLLPSRSPPLAHHRLETCWTILQFPMIKKLEFLEKYAHRDFSMKLPTAIKFWELASIAIPLRERCLRLVKDMSEEIRVSPIDIRANLDQEILKEIKCGVKLPESFLFEERLDKGEVSSEELLEYASIFEKRGTEEDQYLVDLDQWLYNVTLNLSNHVDELSKRMKEEVQEMLIFKGIAYPPQVNK